MKDKIKQWLIERGYKSATSSRTLEFVIYEYVQDTGLSNEWVSVDDGLPITRIDGAHTQVSVLATDGDNVCEISFHSGTTPTEWYEWSEYGDIEPAKITHWQKKPLPPKESGE